MPLPPDRIFLKALLAPTAIGVPDDERAAPQTVEIDAELVPRAPLSGLGDDFAKTVDYDRAARLIRATAAAGERRLIETLAEDIARALLDAFPLFHASVEVRKFILPGVGHVSVRVSLAAGV